MTEKTAVTQGPLTRLVVSAVLGCVAGFAVGPTLGPAAGLLAGWAVGALCAAGWILLTVWSMDAAATRRHALREDPGRAVGRLIAVVGSIAAMGAVAIVLFQSRAAEPALGYLLAGIGVVSVASSWLLIQTDYMLHYARIYFGDPKGGIEFNQHEDPMYTDFAYFAFGIGVAYQVADTNVGSNAIRRSVIAQSLLAYLFGAVVLATVINLVTGLG